MPWSCSSSVASSPKAPDVLVRAAAEMLTGIQPRSRLVVAIGRRLGPRAAHLADRPGTRARDRRPRPLRPTGRPSSTGTARRTSPSSPPTPSRSAGGREPCGTPVVAAAVGGLNTAVADHVSGLLVAGHDPRDFATAIASLTSQRAAPRDVLGCPHARGLVRVGRHHCRPPDQLLRRPGEQGGEPAGRGAPHERGRRGGGARVPLGGPRLGAGRPGDLRRHDPRRPQAAHDGGPHGRRACADRERVRRAASRREP